MSNVFTQFGAGITAFEAPLDARLAFVRRTYLHLTAAIGLLVASSWAFYEANVGTLMVEWLAGRGMFGLLLLFGGLMAVTWLASGLATSSRSPGLQYVGLALYALAMAIVLAPMLMFAVKAFPGAHLLEVAAGLTIVTFGGLSGYVLTTKKDLSFLGPILGIATLVIVAVIVASMIFGFNLGLLYTGGMILFAAGSILYQTSNVVHQYRTDQHVGAALGLFASVVMLFVQILSLLIQLQGGGRRRD